MLSRLQWGRSNIPSSHRDAGRRRTIRIKGLKGVLRFTSKSLMPSVLQSE
jgi:hypothetical protein